MFNIISSSNIRFEVAWIRYVVDSTGFLWLCVISDLDSLRLSEDVSLNIHLFDVFILECRRVSFETKFFPFSFFLLSFNFQLFKQCEMN
jgi:hypothetical protein